jgi:hypothetical protein
VINYALGGIGMTTMFSNGERMVQMIEQNDKTLKKTDKKTTGTDHLLDGIDYSFMTDETQRLSRFLGFNNSLSEKEEKLVAGLILIMILGLIITLGYERNKFESQDSFPRDSSLSHYQKRLNGLFL